ncbi:MAG: NAD(P)H-dependent oxidoreductase [Ferruginibacter sp.]
MNILLFNGEPENVIESTSYKIIEYFKGGFSDYGSNVVIEECDVRGIPFFDFTCEEAPEVVKEMIKKFKNADVLIWLSPLYHGSMTGVMKNTLDWLELTSKENAPYLTDKIVSLICWADGMHALNGINAMEAVAKSLRAWILPFSIPIARKHLFNDEGEVSNEYKMRFDLMIKLINENKIYNKQTILKTEAI